MEITCWCSACGLQLNAGVKVGGDGLQIAIKPCEECLKQRENDAAYSMKDLLERVE